MGKSNWAQSCSLLLLKSAFAKWVLWAVARKILQCWKTSDLKTEFWLSFAKYMHLSVSLGRHVSVYRAYCSCTPTEAMPENNCLCSDNRTGLMKSLCLRKLVFFHPESHCGKRQEVEQKLLRLSGYYCVSLCYIISPLLSLDMRYNRPYS